MEQRVEMVLNFTRCKHIGEAYREMREKMEWADWYGENPDALWDILTKLAYKGDDFIIRRPFEFADIPYGDGAAFYEHMNQICTVFQEAQAETDITVKIEYTDEGPAAETGPDIEKYGTDKSSLARVNYR